MLAEKISELKSEKVVLKTGSSAGISLYSMKILVNVYEFIVIKGVAEKVSPVFHGRVYTGKWSTLPYAVDTP